METISIEKVIKFDNIIENIEMIDVGNDIKYIIDDNSHANAKLNVNGKVKTLYNLKDFNEEVEVDIFTPFNKEIDKDNFKVSLKDFSYVLNQNNVIVYIVLQIEGIIDKNEENKQQEVSYDEIVHSMNQVNDINEDQQDRNEKCDCNESVVIKDNTVKVNNSWSKDLFNLSESYSVLKVFHVD